MAATGTMLYDRSWQITVFLGGRCHICDAKIEAMTDNMNRTRAKSQRFRHSLGMFRWVSLCFALCLAVVPCSSLDIAERSLDFNDFAEFL